MPDDHAAQRTGTLALLLVASVALTAVDVVLLGLAIAFGPSGFGGDRTMSGSEVLVARLGQAAGLAGLILGLAALAWALTVTSPSSRRRGVTWMLVAQLLATAVLVASTL
jgi:hypothetical protein